MCHRAQSFLMGTAMMIGASPGGVALTTLARNLHMIAVDDASVSVHRLDAHAGIVHLARQNGVALMPLQSNGSAKGDA